MSPRLDCKSGNTMIAALALRDELPRVLPREPAKILAFKAGVSKRTIDGIRRGEHVISAAALLELARAYPPVKSLVMRLIGAEPGDDTRILQQIADMVTKR